MKYNIRHLKTGNSVYICESIICRKIDGYTTKRALFISMCGFGPLGKNTYHWERQFRSLETIKNEIRLILKYPNRKYELNNLIIESYDEDLGQKKRAPSIKTLVRQIEAKLIMEKLKGYE